MGPNHLIVLCTCPDRETALRLAEALVDRELAACVNILPGLTSVYRWKGRRETAEELLLLIKTNAGAYPELEKTIRTLHPYELPEVIAVRVERGLGEYLAWIDNGVRTNE